MKKLFAFIALLSIALLGCQQQSANSIKVGTIAGPETQLMEVAKDVAKKKYNLDVDIVTFSDYTLPNEALNDGSIDANMFQHQPYLDQYLKEKNYKLVAIGKTFVYPVGVYSQKIKNIKQTPDNAIVAVPNDPSNEARALILLSKAGLIKLKSGINTNATINDIASNPKKLQFKELDAASLPRVLPDVTLAVINTNYAVPAGLFPNRDAIFVEDKTSPYVNLVVVREADVNNPKAKELVDALHSPEVLQAAKELFKGQAVAGW
jgi:D-methionine transport system substrate-binding protein